MDALTELIKDDMKPALGVTEPGAIAYAAAKARAYTKGEIKSVKVLLNSGMYKNAFSCGIPHSSHVGNVFAAALGATAGDESLGLEVLEHVNEKDNLRVEELVREGKIEVVLDHMGSYITIDAKVSTEADTCTIRIAGGHTHIWQIEKNGEIIFETSKPGEGEDIKPLIHKYTLEQIFSYVNKVPAEELDFIRKAFSMNMELLEEGLSSDKTSFGPQLKKDNDNKIISGNVLKTAQLLCNGAIEARVLGLDKPAMSITGSGAHGIIATLPLLAYYEVNKECVEAEKLLRAAALSCLVTMYIKEYSGKLSAFCGCGIAAGTGMACGLCCLRGGGFEEIINVIKNMASGITGMICDGGNQGCIMKGIVATDAAFRAVDMAIQGIGIGSCHGINGNTPEDTMRHMGQIASPGMEETEKTIVKIMQHK